MAQGTAVESSLSDELPPEELPPEEADGADAAEVAIEARAREMGWKPLAEYRGPPGKWQPAADFIRRGEDILPIVRDQNRRLTERVGKLEGEISGLRLTSEEQLKVIKELRDMGQRANQAGYDRAMAEIKAKQRQAVEAGNTEAYDQLVEQAEALQQSRPAAVTAPAAEPPAEPPARPGAPPALTPTVQAFIRENPWFNTDKLLSDTMVAFHQEVLRDRQVTQAVLNADPALDRELLEEAKSQVVERYPERFGTPAAPAREPAPPRPARRAAAVAAPTAGERPTPPGAALTTINAIADPTERTQAREAFNRMKRQMPDYTEAEYMALWADPHADVLTLQQQKPRSQPNGR
jgi:hypothetical protein